MKKINKKQLVKLLILIVIILITIIALKPINKNYEANAWMAKLSDDTIINEMSIPGTHDSGALHSIFDVAGKCQDLEIDEQLKIGVRFLDIRLKLVDNELVVVHSFVNQDLKFSEVLDDIFSFIDEYNSEFLIISIKEEASPKNSRVSFEEEVVNKLKNNDNVSFENSMPKTLGLARGKIYILNRFTGNEIGLNGYYGWQDSCAFNLNDMYVQDNYSIDNIEVKRQDIINTFEYTINNKCLTFNYLSCYLNNGFPPLYAGTAAKSINKWLDEYTDNNEIKGVVIIDFATEKLVKKIYMENSYEESK